MTTIWRLLCSDLLSRVTTRNVPPFSKSSAELQQNTQIRSNAVEFMPISLTVGLCHLLAH